MRTKIKQNWYISTCIDGHIIDLPYVKEYGKYLILVLDLSPKTIINYIGSLERFWIWSLAVEPDEDSDFPLYISKYRRELKNGFTIYDTTTNDYGRRIKLPILELEPKVQTSIDQEIACLYAFFKWFSKSNPSYSLNKTTINWAALKKSFLNSPHSSYISNNINPITLKRIAKKESNIAKPKKRIMKTDKAFPLQYFYDLINIAEPREKLLYLLLGGTSARIGQALNLTNYDIDFNNKKVYLSDPTIDDPDQIGYLGETRRKWLLTNYNIKAKSQYPHDTVMFKYPIPSKPNQPLYWLHQEVQEMFFSLLAEYSTFPEHLRNPIHPFFFTRKSGERLLIRPAYKTFKKHCRNLSKMHPKLNLDGLALHSLRHMWGNYMAELYHAASLEKIPAVAERIRLYAQFGMGHSNEKSIDTYFNAKMDKVIQEGGEFFVHYMREERHLPPTLFIKGLAK